MSRDFEVREEGRKGEQFALMSGTLREMSKGKEKF